MTNRWLAVFIFAALGFATFLLFSLSVKPIDRTPPASDATAQNRTEPTVTFVNPAIGAREPSVTIVEFADFACTHCRDLSFALEATRRAFPNDVRVVWKNLPNPSANEQSLTSAVAAMCAGRQNAFWEFHDALFSRQALLSPQLYTQIAAELSLDENRFQTCVESQDTYPLIAKDMEEARALGLIATPTLFVGSEKIVGSITAEELITRIQDIRDAQSAL